MPRNWLQKVCDQLSPASFKKVERRPRGRIPAQVEPLEVRSLLAAPVLPGGQNYTLGENIGVNLAAPYVDPATGVTAANTINGTVVGNVNATDADGDVLSFSIPGFNANSPFSITTGGQIRVNNFAAINFENTTTFTVNVDVRDVSAASPSTTSGTVTVNLTNRNDVPFIQQNQTFVVPENSVAGTPLTGNGGVVVAFTAVNHTLNNPGTNLNPNDPLAGGRGTNNISGQTDSGTNSAGDGVQNTSLRYQILGASTSTTTPGVNGSVSEIQRITKPTSLELGQFVLSYSSTAPVTETTKGTAVVDEVQTLDMGAFPNANKFFTLSFNGQTTKHLHYNSTAAEVQAELQLLSTIGNGNINVTGGGGGGAPWVVTFVGQLSKTDVNSLSVTAFTDALSYFAGAAAIENALTGLPTIGAGNVAVSVFTAGSNDGWQVDFQGALANTDVNQIGVINQSDMFTISSDIGGAAPTLARLTVSYTADPYFIGSRADGQTGLVSGTEFLNNFFGSANLIPVLIRVQDFSTVNSQGTNVRGQSFPFNQTLSYDEYVGVTIADQSEAAPLVTDKTFTVPENSPSSNTTPTGTVIGKVDEPANLTDVTSLEQQLSPNTGKSFSYAIVGGLAGGNINNAFAINSVTSEITVANAAALDWETKPTYRILVRVTDNASPNLATIAAMDINLTDVNEPTTVPDGQQFNVAEMAAVGTQLGSVRATDLDNVPPRVFTYEITNGNLNNTFAIDPFTGVITVANNAFLVAATHPSFTLGVRVVDRDLQLSSDVNTVEINVVPANTVAPIINDAAFSLNESPSAVAGTFVGNVTATTVGAGQTISSYSIVNNTSPFVISNTGNITVNNPAAVDFESQPVWTLVVRADDNSLPNSLFSTAIVTIYVNDINEQIVMADQTRTIAEDATAGTNVGAAVVVSDPDDNDNVPQGKVFKFVSGNIGNVFAINSSSGQITIANPAALNFEARSQYSLIVQVNDTGTPNTAAIATVTVNVTNANDAPLINDQTLPSVIEHRLPGTSVGFVTASDQDTGQTLTYTILGGNTGGAFALDPVTGQVTIANPGAVDFNQNPVFNLLVQVTDAQGSSMVPGGLSDNATVTINVLNVTMPEEPRINDQTMLLLEGSAPATVVGNLGLTGGTGPFNYTITSGNTGNTFAVNAAGEITVANASLLNFETNPSFTLLVTVIDNSNPQLTDNATITINLTDVNEQPSINSPTFVLAENASVGAVVGAVTGTDPDAGQTLTYAIVSGNTGGAFAINAVTGQITVANPAAVDFEVNPVFVLNVTATDNGAPSLVSPVGVVTINLTNQQETPVVQAAMVLLPENSPVGTLVHTVVATDQDAGQTLTYAITGGNTNNTFAINSTTGEITVADPTRLDYENQPPFQLVVTVTDNGAPTQSGSATITVKLTDVNDAPRVYNASVTIPENSPVGALVLDYKIVASDRDKPAQTLTYAITGGNTAGAFVIDSTTGVITVANPAAIDAEVNPFFNLTIQVTDNGAPPLASSAQLVVNIGNINDPPTLANQTVNLPENSAVGTLVTTANGADPEGQSLTYAITAGNTNANGTIPGVFSINPATGAITVAKPAALDFENQPPFNLTVMVTDSGNPALSASAVIRVVLTDVNDAPRVYNASKTIVENLPTGTLVLDYKIVASDRDRPAQTLTYAITGGNTSNAFAINPTTGLITVNNAAAIDFETNPIFNLTIQVTDNGAPPLSSTATLTINLTNVNDPPTIPPQAFSLTENSPLGTVVGTVTSSDGDAGQTRTYAITAGNANGAFSINAVTGEIRVANPAAIDFETTPVFTLTVSATDNGNPAATGNGTVTISLLNVNDPPTILPQTFSVAENSAAGTQVGTVVAVEADPGQSLTYAITAGNTLNAFSINSSTGVLTVNNPLALNFEATPQFQLTVRVIDNGQPAQQRSALVTVDLTNVNEVPKFALNNPSFTIAESSPAGTIVGTNAANDPDAGTVVTYAITGGNSNGAFSIDASGNIRVANPAAIDFESGQTNFTLVITATDNGNPALQATTNVAITVLNANDPPVVQPKAFTIFENSNAGAFIGTIVATDQDPGQTRTFAITGGNVNGAFSIDPSTGVLSVGNAAALDFETTPIFNLTVTATDNGSPARSGSAIVTVNLLNRNEPPVVPSQQFTVQTAAANGTVVGNVVANDPDAGQTKTYSIVGGNGAFNNIFAINAATGQLRVNNRLGILINGQQYNLQVRVVDNGNPALSTIGNVRVIVSNTGRVESLVEAPAPAKAKSSSAGLLSFFQQG